MVQLDPSETTPPILHPSETHNAGKGKAEIKTVQGETLTFMMNGDNVAVGDAKGNWANITITNVNQSNGVIHVIDRVLMP